LFKNGETQGHEKTQGAQSCAEAVWIFSLTQQIAIF
jgi:hypothetical protein